MANIVNLVVVAATNFILPKYTSLETYAATKEYTLYITTYSNILSAGYIQGVYLKYGGKEIDESKKSEIGEDYYTFLVFQLIVAGMVSVFGVIRNSNIIKILGIGLFSTNLVSYYQYLYQAVGDFKSYGVALNATRIISLVLYVILLFGLGTENTNLYLAVPIAAAMVIAVFLTVRLNKQLNYIRTMRVNLRTGWINIKNGFVLMLGSFASRFFTTIDRWFVNTLMSTSYFASYSFAVSLENIVNSFMSPLTISLYNYFCKEYVSEEIRLLKDSISIYGCFIVSSAFFAKWVLEHYMVQYLDSIMVIFPLFAAQGIGTVVKAIYVNQYKANGQQKKYLRQIILMLCISVILNLIFYFVLRNMFAIAMATLLTNVIWLVLCEYENPEIRYHWRSVLTFGVLIGIYLFAGFYLNSVQGFLLYVISIFVICLLFIRKSFALLTNKGVQFIKRKLHGI